MSFVLALDVAPPANPSLLINGGAAVTALRPVLVALNTADYLTGAQDVAHVRLWGDVDPAGDPGIQPNEVDSAWLPFEPEMAVLLSAGDGRKFVRARLRDSTLNTTVAFEDFIDLDATTPFVTITSPPTRGRISKVSPVNVTTFGWQGSVGFDRYEVRVVPSAGSPHQAGVLIGSAGGSLNVSEDGAFDALTPIATTISGTDLETASPGSSPKVIKVFIRSGGVWSA